MAEIDLGEFAGDEFVFHFGGRSSEVDAYTFANSLIAFSEAIREINSQLTPGTKLEITIDGIGEGSFRAKLRTTARSLSDLLRPAVVSRSFAKNIVIPIFLMFIYDKYVADHKAKIIINDDRYIVEFDGGDRVILPKDIYIIANMQ